MTQIKTTVLRSISELRDVAELWDDLWLRSRVTIPTVRAELVAQWHERFISDGPFRAVVIEQDGRFVAAMAFVGKKIAPLIEAASLPANEWSPCGELLLDENEDAAKALDCLVAALDELPWQLCWFNTIPISTSRWKLFLEAVDRRGLTADFHPRFRIGLIETNESLESCEKAWSKNHRRAMKKSTRHLAELGSRLCLDSRLSAAGVESAMMRGFDIEDRSWKGESGTSILQSGMADYYVKQAQQLAQWGHLQLAWLEIEDRPIAFEYAWNAKQIYHSFKVGYDPEFAKFSPGQALVYELMREFTSDTETMAIDCLGPMTSAIERWKPSTYEVGRLVIAPRKILGRALVYAYKHVWPRVRQLRGRRNGDTSSMSPKSDRQPSPSKVV